MVDIIQKGLGIVLQFVVINIEILENNDFHAENEHMTCL